MNSYETYLDKVVELLYDKAYTRFTWEEWADEAGVSRTTVNRLGTRVTKRPQLRTIFLLAKAVNVDLPSIQFIRKLRVA